MPDSRSHRGPHPEDEQLFSPSQLPSLRAAATDLSWLLSRGYSETAALEFVGNRYGLRRRQREALSRAVCSDQVCRERSGRCVGASGLCELWIDGFNVLLTLEVALGGGPVFVAQDGCLRDIASVHGTYRKVHETAPAVELLTDELLRRGIRKVRVLLDEPVSNSARLAQVIRGVWQQRPAAEVAHWEAVLVRNPDEALVECGQVVASADRDVLDRVQGWANLTRTIVERHVPDAFLVDLRG